MKPGSITFALKKKRNLAAKSVVSASACYQKLSRFATRRRLGATFHLTRHNFTEWSVRKLLERRPRKSKYAVLGARLNYIRIRLNGRAFQSPKLLMRSSPHLHMAPLLTKPDIFST